MSGGAKTEPRVVIIGRGRFASTLLAKLSATLDDRVQIVQCYREPQLSAPASCASIRGVHQVPVRTLVGEEGLENLKALMLTWKPDAIVCAASGYSPYGAEGTGGTGGPFGATLPFQLPLALNVARAAHSTGNFGLLLNACYPELVNPLTHLLDVPFDAGLGNAQTMNWAQDFCDRDGLFALAHHTHLGKNYANAPLMYDIKSASIHLPATPHIQALERRRALPREARNDLGATAAAALVTALFNSNQVKACLPGVRGETGAMPVSLGLHRGAKTRVELLDIDLNQVRSRHQQECLIEGWEIRDGFLELTSQAHAGMGALAPDGLRVKRNELESWVSTIERSL